ncbi:hypothetical protein DVH05_014462 [Phytophthora capsici]|nr:hypothetical protein DVH05_014462 [Phytophthora capsici]
MEFDRQLQKAIQEVYEFKEGVHGSDGSADEAPMISMDIDDEGLDGIEDGSVASAKEKRTYLSMAMEARLQATYKEQ